MTGSVVRERGSDRMLLLRSGGGWKRMFERHCGLRAGLGRG